jgi:hypothetical protein
MYIFTEGHDPLDTPGVNPMGRMPYGKADPPPFSQPVDNHYPEIALSLGLLFIAVCAARWLWHRRAVIGVAADSAVIGGLAAGVMAKRAMSARKASLIGRVIAKADTDADTKSGG